MHDATDAPQSTPPGPELVLRVDHLCKTFLVGFIPIRTFARRESGSDRPELESRVLPRQVEAVKDLSFSVNRGEIFGLLGPNGSGKTTTIKILTGLIFPSSGSVEVLGRRVPDVEVKARIGFLPENPTFYEYLRADELLELSARLCGVPKAERRRRIPELLARVGLAEALNRPLRKFSKGMQQRIGLAQALVHDPELVVLDEPMSGLDPIGRKEVRDLILDLRRQGKTVIFSTHILSDVEMLCDRVAIMVRGVLRSAGPLHELLSSRIQETEVVLERVPEALLAELAAEGTPALVSGARAQVRLLGDTDPGPLLTRALAAGARVIAVTPRTESLEDLFVQRAKEG